MKLPSRGFPGKHKQHNDLYCLHDRRMLARTHSTEMYAQMLENEEFFYARPHKHAVEIRGFTSIHSD